MKVVVKVCPLAFVTVTVICSAWSVLQVEEKLTVLGFQNCTLVMLAVKFPSELGTVMGAAVWKAASTAVGFDPVSEQMVVNSERWDWISAWASCAAAAMATSPATSDRCVAEAEIVVEKASNRATDARAKTIRAIRISSRVSPRSE